MYELMDGVISILGGTWGYLAATGRVQISSNEEKSKEWRNKFGTTIKFISPFLIVFGLYRLSSVFFRL